MIVVARSCRKGSLRYFECSFEGQNGCESGSRIAVGELMQPGKECRSSDREVEGEDVRL